MRNLETEAPSLSVTGGMAPDREKRDLGLVLLWIAATLFPAAGAVPWNALNGDSGILVNAATHKGELIAWLFRPSRSKHRQATQRGRSQTGPARGNE